MKNNYDYLSGMENDFGFTYTGSAFNSKPLRNYEDLDGDALLNMMPFKHDSIKSDYMDVIEADCLKWMKINAQDRNLSCRYYLKEIIPGLPPIDTKKAKEQLYRRLIARPGIYVLKDTKSDCLHITWAKKAH